MNKTKTFFINILKFIIKKLDIIIQIKENKNPEIEILSPVKYIKKNDKYLDLLEKAIRHDDVYNICLSGDYGSGKSSIIESFKLNFPNFRYLNISLANFNDNYLNGDDNSLEKAIVKQLFYKTNHKKIPSSRFTKIRDISIKKTLYYLVILTIIFSPIILLNLNYWKDILSTKFKELNNILPFGEINFGLLFFLIVISLVASAYILSKIFNKISFAAGIKKENFEVSVQSNAEKSNAEKSNAFDQYIDELIYFFNRNDYDVLFFEDLDRFNKIDIFTKLRDLNRLLNDSEEVFSPKKHKRKIKFVYAIKDSIFVDGKNLSKKDNADFGEIKYENYILDLSVGENRTKFFDYIIPVIPYMDANNSYNDLQKRFNDNNIKIEDEFISDITVFITDKRLLTNTVNEFLLYKDKLKHLKEYEYKYLFSIILYKNIYPIDFLNLTNQEGFLYEIINNKKIYIQRELEKINSKIEEIENKIGDLNNKITQDDDDLLSFILGLLARKGYYSIDNKAFDNISLDDIKNIMNKEENDRISANSYYQYVYDIFTDEIKSKILEKENLIKNNEFSEKNKLTKELLNLKHKRKILLEKTLSDLILDSSINIDFGKNKLIKVLLMKGYINERYTNYISYFREGEINFKELEFIQSVISKTFMPINYELNNIDKIIKRIDIKDLSDEYILNLYLIVDLILDETKFDSLKYDKILSQFNEINYFKLNFLERLSEFNLEVYGMLIKKISINNKNLFKELCFNNKSNDFINLNFKIFINKLSIDELINQNINSSVEKFILSEKNILSFDSIRSNKNKFINIINKLDIKFNNLNPIISKLYSIDIKDINSVIYNQNMYEINQIMIDYIYNYNTNTNFILKNISYSMIKNSKNDNMKNYIDSNINFYIKNVFLNKNYVDNDKIEYIIELLNSENLNKELQLEIIQQKIFSINILSEITNNNILDQILINNRINISWSNLKFYFNKKGLNDYLISYLNSEYNVEILKDKIIPEEVLDSYFDFKCKIILEQKINDKSIEKFKNLFNKPLDNINLSNISNERLLLLIQLKIIELTPSIYNPIAKKSNSIVLIEQNIDKYMDNREYYEYSLNYSEVKYILKSKNISSEQKSRFLSILESDELNLSENYKFIGDFVLKKNITELSEIEEKVIELYFEELKENINTMSLAEIKLTLSKLKVQYEGFNILKSGSFKINIDDNLDKDFLDILKIKGVISSFTFLNDYEVKINRKKFKI